MTTRFEYLAAPLPSQTTPRLVNMGKSKKAAPAEKAPAAEPAAAASPAKALKEEAKGKKGGKKK